MLIMYQFWLKSPCSNGNENVNIEQITRHNLVNGIIGQYLN